MPALRRCLLIAGFCAIATSCAGVPPQPPENACLRHFRALDARIDAAGARDYGAHRLPAFPWLRLTRFSASLRDDLRSEQQWSEWLAFLRQTDMQARSAELRNAAIDAADDELRRLRSCGEQLNSALLQDHAAREVLRQAATVPADYSLAQRLFGLYPLALPLLRLGIDVYQSDVMASYQRPLEALPVSGSLQLYHPPATAESVPDWSRLPRNTLDMPVLGDDGWQALARRHAPALWVDVSGSFDRPGRPLRSAAGPRVDVHQPVVYFHRSYTRFDGEILPQLVYVVWFDARPAARPPDAYAGRLDGLVWRVTLDTAGQPLFYDSIHACGCYHRVFPAQPLEQRPLNDWRQEPLLFPQAVVPPGPVALRLASGTHHLQRVVALTSLTDTVGTGYALIDYTDLLTNAGPEAAPASLFGRDGLVAGTERLERWWLWPSGVHNPGAMRQRGRHAIAFAGVRHFDDPHLPDQLFEPRSPR